MTLTVPASQLHRPVADWPLLLAGPMLRRVTATSVAVFIAASEPLSTATLTVYDGVEGDRRALEPQGPGVRKTTTLGARLHVCVVEATGLELAAGHLYGYDLVLQPLAGPSLPLDLRDLGLLADPVPLGYIPGFLPGFVLPGPLDTLRVVHASCRKPHGCVSANLTDPDALPLVDRLIQDRRADPWNRPQQLMLTGDQIYSDDVPAALLAALMSAGGELLGWPEELPDRSGGVIVDPSVVDSSAPSCFAPGGARSVLLDAQGVKDRPPDADPAKWESDWAANHLLFFSEWCAMYLFAWSPELWQRAEDVPGADPDVFLHYLPSAGLWALPPSDPATAPDTTFPALVYAQNLAFVRRALANVATCTVFDDHDFTDDWFLNAKLEEQERGTPLGRRLLRNALCAYAVFQHWGNAPEAFANGTVGGDLLALLDAESGTPAIGTSGQETAADEVLDIGNTPVGPDGRNRRMRWDYELLFEEHRLIVLDTRTWRHFPTGPRPVTESQLVEAGRERGDITIDWGPERLTTVAELWADAAATAPPDLEEFLLGGAGLISSCAALARIADAQLGEFATGARAVLAAGMLLLDLVLDAPGTAGQPPAAEWLEAAREAIGSPEYAPGGELVDAVLLVATALSQAVFLLRDGQDASLDEGGVGALDDEALAYFVAIDTLSELYQCAAAFLQGAVHARPRAARNAFAMVVAWDTLTFDSTAALWGAVEAAAAGEALADVAQAAAPLTAELATTAAAFDNAADPVWALVNDADRRRAAELVSAEALLFQVHERVWATESRRPLTMVVSGTPVLGHALAEIAQRAAIAWDGTDTAEETNENEPWAGNQPALIRLLDALTPLQSIVVLSGDVHYAFSSVTDYLSSAGHRARFVQLTSSSAKNAWPLSKALALFEEEAGKAAPTLTTPLDYLENLPTQATWDGYSAEARGLIPSREQVLTAMATQRDAAAAARADPADSWWGGLFDMPSLRGVLEDSGGTAWDVLNEDTGARTAEELGTVAERWEDPVGAFANDRVHSAPLAEQRTLALGDAARVDPRLLPEQHTTILRDRRDEARAADSPGLEARLAAAPVSRWSRVRMDRTSVGHANIGVVTTRVTPLGRFVAHELHWFCFDTPAVQLRPDRPGASFREDWIITRHCAGLTRGMPADGSLVGACGPGPPTTPDVGLRIDVTSPGQTESGRLRVHAITEAAPTMPDILVRVHTVGMTAAAERAQARSVRLTCTYREGDRADVVCLPGPTEETWLPLAPGRTSWRPSLPHFCGGDLLVHAKADFGGVPLAADTALTPHVIFGRNPAKAEIRAQAAAAGNAELGTNADVVFHRESSFTQFATSAAALGPFVDVPAPVLRSPRTSFGAGQLDDPDPDIQELWHWRKNVDAAVARLAAFREDARTYEHQVQQGLAWDAATGTLEPPPPGEGDAHPDAPAFTVDQLDLEMWARYNSGRRFHDLDPSPNGGGSWVQQPSTVSGVTVYAPALLAMRRRVDAGDLPADW